MSQTYGLGQWMQYPTWARGPARIEGDEIVMLGERAEEYYLYEPQGLMFDLAELAADPRKRDARDIVAFVRRHGLLWHGADDVRRGECREQLDRWWQEARLIGLLLRLYSDLKDSINGGSADPLRRHARDYLAFTEAFTEKAPDDGMLMEQASVFLAELVSRNLVGTATSLVSTVQLDVSPAGAGTFLLGQNPPDLLATAYVNFIQAVVSRAPITECPGCGRMFIPESGKQKYHSKGCASTSRWRRWKGRQAE